MTDQFAQRPTIQRLLIRLEGQQIVRRQILETIGQLSRDRFQSFAEADEIEKLLLARQVDFGLNGDAGALEEVHPRQAKQSMQRSRVAHQFSKVSWVPIRSL